MPIPDPLKRTPRTPYEQILSDLREKIEGLSVLYELEFDASKMKFGRTPGTDGALFQPSDPEALAGAVADVAAYPEKYESYGRRARETYEQRFNPDRSLERLLEIYSFAITHPVSGRAPR